MFREIKKKHFILIILTLLPLIFITINFNTNIIQIKNSNLLDKEENGKNSNNLNIAKFWTLKNTFIHIKNNWTQVNSTFEWCNGKGTYAEPYIIENLTIDAGGKYSGIIIENSRVYFIIRNCTIFNSSKNSNGAALKIINTTNGIIEKNNFSNNNGFGIFLNSTHNFTISQNIIQDNKNDGIYANGCQNNTFYKNSIKYNTGIGLNIENCRLNLFNDNIVKNASNYGIYLKSSDNNTVKYCIFDHCGNYGIYLDENSDENWIHDNYIGYCYYSKEDGKCVYIIDKGKNNHIFYNDWLGNCQDDPVYGELEEPALAISGYNIIELVFISIISISAVLLLIKKKLRKNF
ncbi:MAG: right-handed parallel beta-helix repeat-containing protein [Promethearchaeota archaeon]